MVKPASLLKGFERDVAKVKPNGKKQIIFDPETSGLALVVTKNGKKSFTIMTRNPEGKQKWSQIGTPSTLTVAEARQKAAEAIQRVKQGQPALPPAERPKAAPETFKAVAARFLERHVDQEGLLKGYEVKRQLERYVYPEWQNEPFESIRRGRVADLLDKINDKKAGESGDMGGAVMADRVLSTLRKLFNWYEVRNEEYSSPIVRGMRTNSSKARDRFLTDEEIRALWADWTDAGTFGAFLKVCLLTAQRKGEVIAMRWDEISEQGVWTIPAEERGKSNGGTLILPPLALAIIKAQPQIAGNPYVFAGRGGAAIGNLGNDKRLLDARVPTAQPWRIHDLRRTASTLMNRAGIRDNIVERVLGHKITGVAGVYNRHSYTDEKGEALAALALMVERILAGEQNNVVQLGAAR